MTIMIELEDPDLNVLKEEAARLGIAVEQLAHAIIHRHVGSHAQATTATGDNAFRKAMADTFRENNELYRRLAR